MAFFENLGKKLTDAGQNVAQQTKNLTDVARLNSTISDKEKQISRIYLALGQFYYAKYKDDPAAEEAQKITEINTLLAEIAQCQEEIRKIKGIATCPGCGAEVALNSAFCNACGTKMPQPEVPAASTSENTKTCPNCHAEVDPDNLFCNQCGTKLDGPAQPLEQPPVQPPEQSE